MKFRKLQDDILEKVQALEPQLGISKAKIKVGGQDIPAPSVNIGVFPKGFARKENGRILSPRAIINIFINVKGSKGHQDAINDAMDKASVLLTNLKIEDMTWDDVAEVLDFNNVITGKKASGITLCLTAIGFYDV